MSKTITFRFEPGDTVFYTSLFGIHKSTVIKAEYDTHTERLTYTIDNGKLHLQEENLYESVEDLRKNLKYLGDD